MNVFILLSRHEQSIITANYSHFFSNQTLSKTWKLKPLSWQYMYLIRMGYQADDWWIQKQYHSFFSPTCLQLLKIKLLQNEKNEDRGRRTMITCLSKPANSRFITSHALFLIACTRNTWYGSQGVFLVVLVFWQPEKKRHRRCYCYKLAVP